MSEKTIIVPVDGATNIKLETLDFDSLATLASASAASPACTHEGLLFNDTGAELAWFDSAIAALPEALRAAAVIAPVARGCSGGLVDADNRLCEVPGRDLTLSYSQRFDEEVEQRFAALAGQREEFFVETGSIRDFPGSLTLLKRFVFEEMRRGEALARAKAFGIYGVLMSGHYLGGDYLGAIAAAGNEHSYWMCHSGTRNVQAAPGTPSTAAAKVPAFGRLVPARAAVAYRALGQMPQSQADALGLSCRPTIVPGGHDTCLSHIPIMSTFRQAFPEMADRPVIQVEGGTWTMIAQIGGRAKLPGDGYARDILVQGTVDGQPVVTARYGGGNDFKHVKELIARRTGPSSDQSNDQGERLIAEIAAAADCFVIPNIAPANHGTGPFPDVKGRIVNEQAFYADAARASVVLNLTTATMTAHQVQAIAQDASVPLVLTAGASKDPYFGRLLATLTGRATYAMFDRDGNTVAETTTLGAAICAKAALGNVHPYDMDVSSLGVTYKAMAPLGASAAEAVRRYRGKLMTHVCAAP
ncbi:MAG: hypothetical protein ABFD92_15645 [Planctomycetaceae bacterium]|nr:hypothetical protein [Planctomycetaceae bacterium]